MATTKITTTTSRLQVATPAFFSTEGTPGPDTLIVDPSAYLVSGTANAVELGTAGAWTLNIQGWVTALNGIGVFQIGGTDAFSLTVGADGSVFGGGAAVISQTTGAVTIKNAGIIQTNGNGVIEVGNASKATITNSGRIQGNDVALEIGAATTTLNNTKSGLINGDIDLLGNGKHTVTNAGTINGNIDSDGTDDILTNSGTISGLINLGNGNNKFVNSGSVVFSAYVAFGGNNDTATNSGLIETSLLLGEGKNIVTNSGTIVLDVTFGNGDDTFTNSGKNSVVQSSVELGDGKNKFSNAGTVQNNVLGGAFVDHVTNSGALHNVFLNDGADVVMNSGNINGLFTGAGNDVVTNNGTIGSLLLGAGDDKYTGGAQKDFVRDSEDSDTISLGGGDDLYITEPAGVDGTDKIDGGAGIDTYSIIGLPGGATVNLDSVTHAEDVFLGTGAAKNSAKAITPTPTFGDDIVLGFENVNGSVGSDVIYGNSAANKLLGFGGQDVLAGYAGNDILDGGIGFDGLLGGAGADQLYGGNDDDTFFYTALTDSGVGIAKRDRIEDFTEGDDEIQLWFDANTKVAGHQNFTFVGGDFATFTGTAGQLRAVYAVDGWLIEGDVNGDAKPDFQIEVTDIGHVIEWNFSLAGAAAILQ